MRVRRVSFTEESDDVVTFTPSSSSSSLPSPRQEASSSRLSPDPTQQRPEEHSHVRVWGRPQPQAVNSGVRHQVFRPDQAPIDAGPIGGEHLAREAGIRVEFDVMLALSGALLGGLPKAGQVFLVEGIDAERCEVLLQKSLEHVEPQPDTVLVSLEHVELRHDTVLVSQDAGAAPLLDDASGATFVAGDQAAGAGWRDPSSLSSPKPDEDPEDLSGPPSAVARSHPSSSAAASRWGEDVSAGRGAAPRRLRQSVRRSQALEDDLVHLPSSNGTGTSKAKEEATEVTAWQPHISHTPWRSKRGTNRVGEEASAQDRGAPEEATWSEAAWGEAAWGEMTWEVPWYTSTWDESDWNEGAGSSGAWAAKEAVVDLNSASSSEVEVSGRKGRHGTRTAPPHEGGLPEAPQAAAAAQVRTQQENRFVRPREAAVAEAPQVHAQQEKEETGPKTAVVTKTRVWRSRDARGAAQGARP